MEKYKILGNIGEGAHGIVYKARNRQSGCLCALKKIALRKIEQQGFPVKVFREIKVLQHIRDIGESVESKESKEQSKNLKSTKIQNNKKGVGGRHPPAEGVLDAARTPEARARRPFESCKFFFSDLCMRRVGERSPGSY